jgi:hypothetical protein
MLMPEGNFKKGTWDPKDLQRTQYCQKLKLEKHSMLQELT